MIQIGQQGMTRPSMINQGIADNHPPSVHAPGASSPAIQQPVLPQPFALQVNEINESEFFSHAQLPISQTRGRETSSLTKNNYAQRIFSRQQINFVPRAPNATLPPFRKRIIQPPQKMFPRTQAPHQVQTPNSIIS